MEQKNLHTNTALVIKNVLQQVFELSLYASIRSAKSVPSRFVRLHKPFQLLHGFRQPLCHAQIFQQRARAVQHQKLLPVSQ